MIPLGIPAWAGYRWIHISNFSERLVDFFLSVGMSFNGNAQTFHYDDDGFLGEHSAYSEGNA